MRKMRKMKKMTNTAERSFLIAVLLLVSFAYANNRKGDCTLKIETGKGKAVSFTLNPAEEASLSIYDQKGGLIYQSTVNKLDVLKTVSLEGFTAGIYYLEIAGKGRTIKHEIKVVSKDSKKVRMEESVNDSPAFRR